ncbi:MAG TPA: glycogen synthase [Mycobacteriales bacterium]|nr:glycogen synthase [Mycobacteriales bacterium]
MRVGLLTREYPPEVYGGAGVHVEYLARELARLTDVTVHCFGAPREAADPDSGPTVVAHQPWELLAGQDKHLAALETMSVDLTMAAVAGDLDLVHSHTWYANFAGHLAKLTHGIPHVVTTHSLEPMRPWKAEQLGGGYALSSFCERTSIEAADAVIAVSEGMRRDVLSAYPDVDPAKVHVVYNGIDTAEYRRDDATGVLERYGVDPARPYVLFVGRITRQKGLTHLIDAAAHLDPAAQLVLCAGAPDTREIAAEIEEGFAELSRQRGGVIWIREMLAKPQVVQLLGHATVFVCPSIYEPLGIVNLEAMACGTAVVATATGGIPEVVVDGETGLLVPFEPGDAAQNPADPGRFARDIADRLNELVADPARADRMGDAGRERAVQEFSWSAIAAETLALYERLTASA